MGLFMVSYLCYCPKLHGWARIKVYESGVHIIAVEAEGDTKVRLSLDANLGVRSVMHEIVPAGGRD